MYHTHIKRSCRCSAAELPRTLELKNCRDAGLWPCLCFGLVLICVDEDLVQRKLWSSHLGKREAPKHSHPHWVSELQMGQSIWAKTLIFSQTCIIYSFSLLPHQSLPWICLGFFWNSSISSMLSNYKWFSFITKNLVSPNKTDQK